MTHTSHQSSATCHKKRFYGFSATWPEDVRRLAESYMTNPMQVFVGTLDLTVPIKILFQTKVMVSSKWKML